MWNQNQQPDSRGHRPMVHHCGWNPPWWRCADQQCREGDLHIQPDGAGDAGAARWAGDWPGHWGLVQLGPGRGGVEERDRELREAGTPLPGSIWQTPTWYHLVYQQRPEERPQRRINLHRSRAEREQPRSEWLHQGLAVRHWLWGEHRAAQLPRQQARHQRQPWKRSILFWPHMSCNSGGKTDFMQINRRLYYHHIHKLNKIHF